MNTNFNNFEFDFGIELNIELENNENERLKGFYNKKDDNDLLEIMKENYNLIVQEDIYKDTLLKNNEIIYDILNERITTNKILYGGYYK